MSETAPELSEPSDPQESTQMNATSLHFPGDAPEVTCIFCLSFIIHISVLSLVGLSLPSFLRVFPVQSLCFLLHHHIFYLHLHSPGASLLQCCISRRVSGHHFSHGAPQHAVNGALADSDFLIMEVRRQHQHLLAAHVFEGVAVALKPHINICLILSIKFQL